MKRFLGITLGVVLVLLLMTSVALADGERQSGDFTYKIKGNGTAVITKFNYENMAEGQDIYIPRMLDGYTVTEIGEFAFSIYSFDENGVPVVSTDYYPEDELSDLELEIYLLMLELEPKSFGSLVLSDTITTIGKGAFFGTSSTSKAINIPDSVQYIGEGAFSNISGVEQFVVGAQNSVYATIDGVLFDKKEKALLAFPRAKKGTETGEVGNHSRTYTIPEGIVSIADYACYGFSVAEGNVYSSYKSSLIVFPETLTKIGNYSFAYARISTEVTHPGSYDVYYLTLPKSVSQLGIGSFSQIGQGDHFKLDLSLTNLLEIPDYAFYGAGITSITLPKQLETIGAYAFALCGTDWSFSPLLIPASVKSIGTGAFSSMEVLYRLEVEFEQDSCLQTLGDNAFEETPIEIEIILPNGLKSIGNSAFNNCEYLESITIPSLVSSIGKDVCTRASVYLDVEPGSYAALWASENGYMTTGTSIEDTSWLNN